MTLPDPPAAFGSYDPAEVTWLLTDLSGADLETGTEERAQRLRDGMHYSEVLPIEHVPSAAYEALYEKALATSAHRLAVAVGVVAEQVMEGRGGEPVIVSLARAGTPVGILLRRWMAFAHGYRAPHVAVSVIRDRGVDEVALRWAAEQWDPRRMQVVDGWTGKGVINRELAAALGSLRSTGGPDVSDELAVLADPGRCAPVFGTRDDFLIPSACLNATVSGLVSRTVLNDLIGPGMFHGAKTYPELAAVDRSASFLDAVSDCFEDARAEVDATWRGIWDADRTPDWSGWATVVQLAREFDIEDVGLVKPGVGETTRVLLRRVPDLVLIDPAAHPDDVAHVRLLAGERGVRVVEREDLGYSCVGVVMP